MTDSVINVNIYETVNKTYPIYIDDENIRELKLKLDKETEGRNKLVIISKKVYKLYGSKLNFNKKEIFIMNDGEPEKNIKNFEKIIKKAIKLNLSRKDVMIAIGGGVVGDIVGYAASSYMRGIDFIQVPTTLLACVDSSVGGKTAINSSCGKNYIGAFYQPKAVYINLNFLKTLDEKQYMSGFGEVLKYAFIERNCCFEKDYNLWEYLKINTENYQKREFQFLKRIIKICLYLKSAVVQQDEKEKGLRKILNFGHTFGHAIEESTFYIRYTHGYAVVQGIMYALNLALKKGLCEKTYYKESFNLLKSYGYEPDKFRFVPKQYTLNLMKKDKKSDKNIITFILPTKRGEVVEYQETDFSSLTFDNKFIESDF